MARTTAANVGKVVEVDASIDLEPFIDMANELVTECCVGVNDTEYTAVRLELIERWLAAHFYVIRDPRLASEGIGPMREQAQNPQVQMAFHGTKEGQQALLLDTYGGLAALSARIAGGGKKAAAIIWGGTTDQDEDGVED